MPRNPNQEEFHRQFDAMLEDAMLEEVEAEVAREGTISHEAVLAEMDAIIRVSAKSRRK